MPPEKKSKRVPPLESAANLAALFIERNQLSPPVSVLSLLRQHADVEGIAESWPDDRVDAVMVRRLNERPHVYYNDDAAKHPGRVRFTLGHELAHILIPWHCGAVSCSPLNGWAAEPTTSGSSIHVMEREADAFASGIIIPRKWLRLLIRENRDEMGKLLTAVQAAEVSTTAMLWALRDSIPVPGWVFQINVQDRFYCSRGTRTPGDLLYRSSQEGRDFLNDQALDSGSVQWEQNTVRWWRLVGAYELHDTGSPEWDDRELLFQAMAECGVYQSREQSVNGKVGGGASKFVPGGDAVELFTGLRYRFEQDADYSELATNRYFLAWLARKAIARSKR